MNIEIPDELSNSIRELAQLCYECGVCMGGCPVARVNENFHPRRLMRRLIFDDWNEVLSSQVIWLCAQCHVCSETCPQGVGISELIVDLRNLAINLDLSTPEAYVNNVKQLAGTGRLVNVTSRVERLRDKLELEAIKPAPVGDVEKLIKNTNFEKIVTRTGG